uniref:ATPase subunit 8 n=1 Tax=Xenos vesparum TaxID=31928 RepID=Q0QJ96_9NEOP|nr:ATPase subunit 8 [Xenos vesparum]
MYQMNPMNWLMIFMLINLTLLMMTNTIFWFSIKENYMTKSNKYLKLMW